MIEEAFNFCLLDMVSDGETVWMIVFNTCPVPFSDDKVLSVGQNVQVIPTISNRSAAAESILPRLNRSLLRRDACGL